MSDFSPTLIVPGLHGSANGHWQTWWQTKDRNARRVEQDDWSKPDLDVWTEKVQQAARESRCGVWLVAHSFGCLACLRVAQQHPRYIRGLFLVAPADPDKFSVSHRLPQQSLPLPSILVASRTDPWLHFDKAQRWARTLGSRFIDLGEAGHINLDSGFGAWQFGFDLFGQFARETSAAELHEAICCGTYPPVSPTSRSLSEKPQWI